MTKPKFSKNWVVGIIDAEGSFDVHIFKNSTMKVGEQVQLRLIVTQKSNEEVVLKTIGEFFGAKNKKFFKDKRDGTLYLHIQRQDLVFNKIIPFFQENPLLTEKRKDFEVWVKCANIMKEKRHTKPDGLTEIKELAEIINVKEESVGAISSEIEAIELTPDWVSAFLEGEGSLILDIWDIKPRAGHETIVEEYNNSVDKEITSPNKIDSINVQTHKFKVGFRL